MSTLKTTNIAHPSSASNNIVLDASGRVGIGTATPQGKLVVASSGAGYEIDQSSIANTNLVVSYDRGASAYRAVDNRFGSYYAWNDSGIERARIDSSGRLLVGTSSSSAAAKLIVQGNTSDGAAGGLAQLQIGSTTPASGAVLGRLDFSDSAGYQGAWIRGERDGGTWTSGSSQPGRLVFSTTADGASSPTERMRITSKGHVGIGVTPVLPLQVLQATDNASGLPLAAFTKGYAGDLGHAIIHLSKQDNNSTTSQIFQRFYINAGSTGSGMITANGASQATFSSFSDIRLKENIQDLPSQLQAICSLRPVEFDYKDGSGHQIGFIAQEVEEVYPDLIGKLDNEMLTLSGMGKHEARLIKAIQELKDELDTAKQRIADLEAA